MLRCLGFLQSWKVEGVTPFSLEIFYNLGGVEDIIPFLPSYFTPLELDCKEIQPVHSEGEQPPKNPPASARDTREAVSIPGWGRSPRGGHSSPVQYSCLETSIDRGAWRATVRGVNKVGHDWSDLAHTHARTRKKNICTHDLSWPPTPKQDTESRTQVSIYQRLTAPHAGTLGKLSFRLWKINNHTASFLLGHWESKSQICSHSQRERQKKPKLGEKK